MNKSAGFMATCSFLMCLMAGIAVGVASGDILYGVATFTGIQAIVTAIWRGQNS